MATNTQNKASLADLEYEGKLIEKGDKRSTIIVKAIMMIIITNDHLLSAVQRQSFQLL